MGKSTSKKARGRKGSGKSIKKAGAKKSVRKAAPSKKVGARKATTAAASERQPGNCLDLIIAGRIVQDAIPGGPHSVNLTLTEAGLISLPQLEVLRRDVLIRILAEGCQISESKIPNGADDTLRAVRDTITAEAW
jgi:hypothetical protein